MLKRFAGLSAFLIHGGIKSNDKHHVINKVFQGPGATVHALVGTYRLMGRIYTMTEARRVILFSPTWLKAEEDQARSRVKRIGQTQETLAVRYIADGTVDTLVVRRQDEKTEFDERVLGLPDGQGNRLTEEELLRQLDRVRKTEYDEDGEMEMDVVVEGSTREDAINIEEEEEE